jgi:ABC transporter substrate binding protein (PQQ-dependent alcohol dehydrogenase system)
MRRLLVLILSFWPLSAPAQDSPAEVVIGLVTLKDDPRYVRDWGYARLIVPPPVRSIDGAQMAISDLAFVSDAMGLAPRVEAREVTDGDAVPAVQDLVAGGAQFVLLDLPGDMVETVATAHIDVTLINVSAADNALREMCDPDLLHSFPSDRQMMDAFAQYLRSKDWTDVLILQGETPRDAAIADAFTQSAERLRLSIRDRRPFTLAADPSQREGNNVALLTGGTR